jgi:putative ABC transport system permease protein
MNILRRSVKGITACPFRSFGIAVFVAVFTVVSMASFYLGQICDSYEAFFENGFGSLIELGTKGKDIPSAMLEPILENKHVLGVNCQGDLSATTAGRKLVFGNGSNFDNDEYSAYDFILTGNTDTKYSADFYRGSYELASGAFPKALSNEVLVEALAAERNGLVIGSPLEIECSGISGAFVVSGTYKDPGTFSTVPPAVYCDYGMLKLFDEKYQYRTGYTVYVDGVENLAEVGALIDGLVGGDSSYGWYDSVSDASEGYSGVHSAISNTTKSLIVITYITALLILILMAYLWMRKHFLEAGIYIALGQSKTAILLEFALEIIIISVVSVALFAVLGYFLIGVFSEGLVLSLAQYSQGNYIKQEVDVEILKQSIELGTAIKSSATVLAVALASTSISGISILKYKATELFAVQD